MTVLRTNGVNNSNQTVLDLVAGSNITLTGGAQGKVTVAASGSALFSGSANEVLATPNGSPGNASLRKLVVADLPNPIDIGTF